MFDIDTPEDVAELLARRKRARCPRSCEPYAYRNNRALHSAGSPAGRRSVRSHSQSQRKMQQSIDAPSLSPSHRRSFPSRKERSSIFEPSSLPRWHVLGQWNKDARLIELVLSQSRRIVNMDRGVLWRRLISDSSAQTQVWINPMSRATISQRTAARSRPIGEPAESEAGLRRRDHHRHVRKALAGRARGRRHRRSGLNG